MPKGDKDASSPDSAIGSMEGLVPEEVPDSGVSGHNNERSEKVCLMVVSRHKDTGSPSGVVCFSAKEYKGEVGNKPFLGRFFRSIGESYNKPPPWPLSLGEDERPSPPPSGSFEVTDVKGSGVSQGRRV